MSADSLSLLPFASIRVLHMLFAGLWIGCGFFVSCFLLPLTRKLDVDGYRLIERFASKSLLPKFMPIAGATTIFSGAWLYWYLTGGLDMSLIQTRHGLFITAGAIAGVLAGIIGKTLVGTSAARIASICQRSVPDTLSDTARAELFALRNRMANAARFDLALLLLAFVLMSASHYV